MATGGASASGMRAYGGDVVKRFYVATKAGRRLNPHTNEGYNRENLTAFVERSLKNLATEANRSVAAALSAE